MEFAIYFQNENVDDNLKQKLVYLDERVTNLTDHVNNFHSLHDEEIQVHCNTTLRGILSVGPPKVLA